ncbi:MAG: hypothetical protein K0M50_08915 [Prolixibacteraceae bacterium]|nr:hypothetical protein [Prolixibacteraceae bacterium]
MKTISSIISAISILITYVTFMFIDYKSIEWNSSIFLFSLFIGISVFLLCFLMDIFIKRSNSDAINIQIEKQLKVLQSDIDKRFYHLFIYSIESNEMIGKELNRIKGILYSSMPIQIDYSKEEQFVNKMNDIKINFKRNFPDFKELEIKYEPNRDNK